MGSAIPLSGPRGKLRWEQWEAAAGESPFQTLSLREARRLHNATESETVGWVGATSFRDMGSVIDCAAGLSETFAGFLRLLLRFGIVTGPLLSLPPSDNRPRKGSGFVARFLSEKRGSRGAQSTPPCGMKLSGSCQCKAVLAVVQAI